MAGVFSKFDSGIGLYNLEAQEGTQALFVALAISNPEIYALFLRQYPDFASADKAVGAINDAIGVTERGFSA